MLKHLVTPKCPRHCDYCIAKNMRHPQVVNMRRLKEIYELMRQKGYVDIMLSGGEPTIAEGFTSVLTMAFAIFNNVYLTTADRIWVEEVHARHSMISAITFSVHDLGDLEQFDVVVDTGGVPVYAAIMDHQFRDGVIEVLEEYGFSGLTINENHWGGPSFNADVLPELGGTDFSVRINRRGKCIEDEHMILPSLGYVNSFTGFMAQPGAVREYPEEFQVG